MERSYSPSPVSPSPGPLAGPNDQLFRAKSVDPSPFPGMIPMELSAGRRRSWLNTFAFFCLALFVAAGILGTVSPSTAYAQAGEEKKTEEKAPQEEHSFFNQIIESVGWFFGILLLLVSIGLVPLIVLLSVDLRIGS